MPEHTSGRSGLGDFRILAVAAACLCGCNVRVLQRRRSYQFRLRWGAGRDETENFYLIEFKLQKILLRSLRCLRPRQRLILGNAYGKAAPATMFSETFYADVKLEAGRKLEMPILAIIGGRDVLLDSADTRARLQRTPHAEICYIENGYHFLPDQAPRVMDFLERYVCTGEV